MTFEDTNSPWPEIGNKVAAETPTPWLADSPRHTPGPWIAAREGVLANEVATVYGVKNGWVSIYGGESDHPGDWYEHKDADVSLICAAPKLLATCEQTLIGLCGIEDHPAHGDLEGLRELLRATIAEAKGEAHGRQNQN